MKKIEKIILFIIFLIVFIPIIFNEIKEYNLRKLKEETLEISKNLKNNYDEITQIRIDSNKKNNFKTRGTGKAFVNGDEVTVILSYKKYCSIIYPGLNQVALAKTRCPNLELIKNTVIPIVNKNGLANIDNSYYYKGINVDNYILFNNEYWRILSFEDNKIKIIKDEPINRLNSSDLAEYLNMKYYPKIKDKNLIDSYDYDFSGINITNKIEKKENRKIKSFVGILSLYDYLNTLNDECTIRDGSLLCSESFASKHMWLYNKKDIYSYYTYTDGNVYYESYYEEKDIYPVIVLKEDVEIMSGNGSKDNPYLIK